jgi:prepilin-type N-terminal cleavage/methylation domain-containing protein
MMPLPNQFRGNSGMTLVETVVAISIYAVLMLAVFSSITSLYKTNAYALEQSNEVNSARVGITQWNRDAKEMITAEDGTWPLAIIEPHRMGYYSDTDKDDSVEYVLYELTGTTLTKSVFNPSGTPVSYDLTTPDEVQTLSTYVQNINQSTSTFSYFDNGGNQLTSASPILDVRYIRSQLIVNIDPIRNPGEFMLRSSLAPRNLKDNL